MHVDVDQARRNDQTLSVDYFGIFRRRLRDLSIDNRKIDNFIAPVRGVDDAAVANNHRAHVAIPPQR